MFRAGAEILGIFSTAQALFFVSFFYASKRKKKVSEGVRNTYVLVISNEYFISTFFLKKKVAKKTSAVKKMPNPRSLTWRRKTCLSF